MHRTYLLVRLNPLSPFHLGERGIGLEETETFIHSDTIFSALCNAWVRCHGTSALKDQLLEPLKKKERGALRVSSAYPYAFDTLFFPRPLSPLRMEKTDDPKRMEHARFASDKLFFSFLAGARITLPESLQGGDIWISPAELQVLADRAAASSGRRLESSELWVWNEQEVPRITQDRVSQSTGIFYCSHVTFAPGCGLFFLAQCDAPLRPDFETALRVLGDTGIGGDRTAGYGQFEPDFEEISLELLDDAPHFLTLSLLAPLKEEIKEMMDAHSAYCLTRRDGWIDSPSARNYRRRACRMFAEGSVLKGEAHRPCGRLVKVTPTAPEVRLSHPIYRYGCGFSVPIRVQEEGL